MSDKNLNPDINFLFEMGSMRFIERMWRRFSHDDFANLADHHFRVFWIAMVIASHEKGVDTGKLAKMALVHDIAESRTGDTDYLSRQYVTQDDELAINDMLGGTILEKEFHALWEEYEERESLESRILKDADNLDVDYELAEQSARGSQMQGLKGQMRQNVADNKLYTKTAKAMFEQMKQASPHDWHFKGRNRLNTGEWKK